MRPINPLGTLRLMAKGTKNRPFARLAQAGGSAAVRLFGGITPDGYSWLGSILRRLIARRRRRPASMLRHERVELFLVLGVAQAGQEFLELLLLLLQPPQRLLAVFIESAVAARGRAEAEAMPLHAVLHALHLPLHALHLVRPAIAVVMTPATHFSAPECEKEKGKSDRPPDQEAEDGHGNPAGVPGALEHVGAVRLLHGAAPSVEI